MRHETSFSGTAPRSRLGPAQDSRLASVGPGQLIRNIEVQFDNDAPFLLRGRAYRVSYDSLASRTQVGLQNLKMRWSGPNNDYRQNVLVPQGLDMAYGGQSAMWAPVYPQIAYPANGLMLVDVLNAGATTLTNLTLYFRGVKLFPWGTNTGATYPARMSILPYAYPINTVDNSPTATGAIQNLLTADQRILQTFQVQNDSDFVLRSGQAGPSYAPFALEVFVTLRDGNRKAFSNAPVHFETLFGPSGGTIRPGRPGCSLLLARATLVRACSTRKFTVRGARCCITTSSALTPVISGRARFRIFRLFSTGERCMRDE